MTDKNIWLAAGDNDLDRVRELLDSGFDANALDPNSYSALHAAVSWGNADVLRLLIDRGGNINLQDDDGETPIFTAESVDIAQLCLELGADPMHKNQDGKTPAQHLEEEYPEVALYLANKTGEPIQVSESDIAANHQDASLENASNSLYQQYTQIMQRSEQQGTDPEQELRAIVAETVNNTADFGRAQGLNQRDTEQTGKRRKEEPQR